MNKISFILLLTIAFQAQAGDLSFYVLASEWTGSVCQTNNCVDDQGVSDTFWNIHGLWPSDGSSGLNYCTEEAFDPSQIADLASNLTMYWSGLYSSADAFHSHEWVKHGTCANMTQHDFFTKVLELSQMYDVYTTLSNNGIVPGNSYNCSDVEAVIVKEYNVHNFTLQRAFGSLSAIEICLDLEFNPQDCASKSLCHGTVLYPIFTPNATEVQGEIPGEEELLVE